MEEKTTTQKKFKKRKLFILCPRKFKAQKIQKANDN